jgi:hypothetical protein
MIDVGRGFSAFTQLLAVLFRSKFGSFQNSDEVLTHGVPQLF